MSEPYSGGISHEQTPQINSLENFMCSEIFYTCFQVICMSKEEFQEFQENEGWEEDEDDEDSRAAEALSFEGISALAPEWKQLLHSAAGFTLNLYAEDMETDLKVMEEPHALAKLSHRETRALHVRLGQKSIIRKLQQLTRTSGE